MHGMSVEIRLRDYLNSSVNPRRVKKGLKKLTFAQYRKQNRDKVPKHKIKFEELERKHPKEVFWCPKKNSYREYKCTYPPCCEKEQNENCNKTFLIKES